MQDTLRTHRVTESSYFTQEIFNISTLDTHLIKRYQNKSLADVLESNSGLYIKKYHVGLATVSFRGTNASQTQIFWNDVPVNSSTLGQSDLSLFPTAFHNTIDIQHGASGIYAGAGGLGGSINLSSKPNFSSQKKQVEIEQTIGSFNQINSLGKIRMGNKQWVTNTTLLYHHSENDFKFLNPEKDIYEKLQNSQQQKIGFAQDIFLFPNHHNLVSLNIYGLHRNQEIPPIINSNNTSQFQEDKVLRANLKWKTDVKNVLNQSQVAFSHEKLNYSDTNSSINSSVNSNFFFCKNNTAFNIFKSVKVDAGFTYKYDFVKSDGFDKPKNRNSTSIYSNFQTSNTKRLTLNITLRQELVNQQFIPLIPSIGVNFKLNQRILLKANTTRNYRIPTLNDLYWNPGGNPLLNPESGWSNELGIHFQNKKNTHFQITGYYLLIDDWIQWAPKTTTIWSPQNIDLVESKGGEISFRKSMINSRLNIISSYNYTITKSINSQKYIPYVARHKFTYSLFYKLKSWTLFANQSINSKTYIDISNQYYMPYYMPLNIAISKQINYNKTSWQLHLAINNIFNEDYQIIANRPMPKSNFEVTLNLKFN